MSTGLDCRFIERKTGWFYELERWERHGPDLDYDTFGPFTTRELAERHLGDNHANPGGWSVLAIGDWHTVLRYETGGRVEVRAEWDGERWVERAL
jgi:hypothetical protein